MNISELSEQLDRVYRMSNNPYIAMHSVCFICNGTIEPNERWFTAYNKHGQYRCVYADVVCEVCAGNHPRDIYCVDRTDPFMTVRVIKRKMYMSLSDLYPFDITISKLCPVCGGLRGEPYWFNFMEDGAPYAVHRWENPCGHIDKYEDVIEEAGHIRSA